MFNWCTSRPWAVVLAIGLLGLTSGCGDDGDSQGTEGGSTADRNLVVAASDEGGGFFWGNSWALTGFDIPYNTNDNLLNLNSETAELEPGVAEGWDIDEETNRVTFNLREGITFEGGRELVAGDVKWSYQVQRDCPGYAQTDFGGWRLDDATADVPDDRTFILNVPRGMTRVTELLGIHYFMIWDSIRVSEATGTPLEVDTFDEAQCELVQGWLKNDSAGSGPYAVESWEPGQQIVLVRRDDYWGEPPYFERVTYRVVPDANTRLLLLKQGSVDMAWDIPPAKWKEIDADPNLNLNFGERYDPMFLSLSPNIEPYSDINLRRALIKAFPYETVVREVLGGFSEPRSSFSREREPWYKEYDLFSQDLEQAREFLAQSSYEPGTRLILSMYENDPTDVAVWYQQALNEIGVSVEIQELPLAAWTEQRTTQQLPFLIHQLQSWIPDFSYYAGLSWKEPDNYSNTAGWKNQRAFEIVPEALEILTYDDPRVIELWEEMQDMVAQDAVYAPLFSYGTAMPAKKEIKGYNFVFYSPGADLRSLSREK